jgi:hypothetical protein
LALVGCLVLALRQRKLPPPQALLAALGAGWSMFMYGAGNRARPMRTAKTRRDQRRLALDGGPSGSAEMALALKA